MKTPDPKEKAAKDAIDEPLKESGDPVTEDARSDATLEEIEHLRQKQGDYEDEKELPLKEQS